jgi:tetratricopeptide (TPR) repeat protein
LTPEGKDADLDRLLEQALAFQRAANHRAAVEVYERIIARLPTDARAYNNLAAAYRVLGQLPQAREALRRAIELDPRYAAAWSNLGLVLDALGERQQAAAAFQTALRLDPGNTAASVNLAIQYHQAGLLDEANALLQEALRRDPLMPEAHYELGRLSETRGDRDQALRHYRRFLEIGAQRFPEVAARVRERMAQLTR